VEQVQRSARGGAGDVVGTGGIPVDVLGDQLVVHVGNGVTAADAAPHVFFAESLFVDRFGRLMVFREAESGFAGGGQRGGDRRQARRLIVAWASTGASSAISAASQI
jgi:hypothetical protein